LRRTSPHDQGSSNPPLTRVTAASRWRRPAQNTERPRLAREMHERDPLSTCSALRMDPAGMHRADPPISSAADRSHQRGGAARHAAASCPRLRPGQPWTCPGFPSAPAGNSAAATTSGPLGCRPVDAPAWTNLHRSPPRSSSQLLRHHPRPVRQPVRPTGNAPPGPGPLSRTRQDGPRRACPCAHLPRLRTRPRFRRPAPGLAATIRKTWSPN